MIWLSLFLSLSRRKSAVGRMICEGSLAFPSGPEEAKRELRGTIMEEPLVKRIANAIMSTSHISDLAGTVPVCSSAKPTGKSGRLGKWQSLIRQYEALFLQSTQLGSDSALC